MALIATEWSVLRQSEFITKNTESILLSHNTDMMIRKWVNQVIVGANSCSTTWVMVDGVLINASNGMDSRGHSATTRTKSYPICDHLPLLREKLWKFYVLPALSDDQVWNFYWPPTLQIFTPWKLRRLGIAGSLQGKSVLSKEKGCKNWGETPW